MSMFGLKTRKKVNKNSQEGPKSKESEAASSSQPPERSLRRNLSEKENRLPARLAGLLEKRSKEKKESKEPPPPDLFDPEDWAEPSERGASAEPRKGLKTQGAGEESLQAQEEEIVVNAIDMSLEFIETPKRGDHGSCASRTSWNISGALLSSISVGGCLGRG